MTTDGGTEPLWSPEGNELFYRQGKTVMAIAVDTTGDFEASTPRPLFAGDFVLDIHQIWDVSPDGERFVMVLEDPERPREIRIIRDWLSELEHLVPPSAKPVSN